MNTQLLVTWYKPFKPCCRIPRGGAGRNLVVSSSRRAGRVFVDHAMAKHIPEALFRLLAILKLMDVSN